LVLGPNKKKSIGVKWIYKEKNNAKGEVERYKARLVAKNYNQKQGINYNEVFALIDNIKGKLQEIKDMQAQKLISFGKVKNLVEGLEIQTRFEKIKLLLSTMVKLPSSFFCNDGIRITSTLLRQNIVKRKKMKK
jgi:uncharacterized membrane protein